VFFYPENVHDRRAEQIRTGLIGTTANYSFASDL
jgi:hypothetical protein